MCIGQAAMTFVAQRLLPRLNTPIVLFTTSRDITLPLQRTCGGDPVDGHCKYDDYTLEQQLCCDLASGPLRPHRSAQGLPEPAASPMPFFLLLAFM